MKKLIAGIIITSTLITPCLALTATECQQIQQTAHTMAECARRLGYPEDSVIIQEAQKKWWEAQNSLEAENSVWRGPVLTARAGAVMGAVRERDVLQSADGRGRAYHAEYGVL